MHLYDLCIKWCFVIEVCFDLTIITSFNSRKIFKAYYGFRVLYVFPFPSAGHEPTGSGRDTRVALARSTTILQKSHHNSNSYQQQ